MFPGCRATAPDEAWPEILLTKTDPPGLRALAGSHQVWAERKVEEVCILEGWAENQAALQSDGHKGTHQKINKTSPREPGSS